MTRPAHLRPVLRTMSGQRSRILTRTDLLRARDTRLSPTALLALARRLTARDRWIIRMLHEHRVLTTTHLAALAFPTLRSAQQRLLELHHLGVTDRFQPFVDCGSPPLHHLLGPVGAAVLAAEEGLTLERIGYRRDHTLATAHHLSLRHTIAVNSVFTDLATPTPPRGQRRVTAGRSTPAGVVTRAEGAVLWAWWSELRCARLYGHHVRPDGYGRLHFPAAGAQHPPGPQPERPDRGGWMEFFLEYDRGTEKLAQLTTKLAGYHQLALATAIPTPVLVLLTRPGREPYARDALTRAHAALAHPDLVPVATALDPLLEPRTEHTPATTITGPIWLGLHRDPRHRAHGAGRSTLYDLARRWPAPPPAELTPHRHRDENSARRPAVRRTLTVAQLAPPDPHPPRPDVPPRSSRRGATTLEGS